jgi:putative ABC transport system substrate-binding protein
VLAQAAVEAELPIIALAMGDPVGAGVAESLDLPGGNVTGSIDYIDPARLLDEIQAVQPDLGRIGTVVDPANQNMQVWLADLRRAADERDLDVEEATVQSSADVVTAARSLGGRVDAVLIGPDATVVSAIDAVASFAFDEGLPLYGVGVEVTTPGVLASLGPDYAEVGRLAAEAAAEVYGGADPGEVSFRRPGDLEWTINVATAEELGLDLPAELLERASVIEG